MKVKLENLQTSVRLNKFYCVQLPKISNRNSFPYVFIFRVGVEELVKSTLWLEQNIYYNLVQIQVLLHLSNTYDKDLN